MLRVWDGLRPLLVEGNTDIRFACRQDRAGSAMDVDLSFYDVPFYDQITYGVSEYDTCFATNGECNDATGYFERRDNLSGETRGVDDNYAAGEFEGEGYCDYADTFMVDFDDGGAEGNDDTDGTDWGKKWGSAVCGDEYMYGEGAWFIFARELTGLPD